MKAGFAEAEIRHSIQRTENQRLVLPMAPALLELPQN
jgi:hypothetical protein